MSLLLRRGLEADRLSITPMQGEPIYTTDLKVLWIGDGVTPGGVAVGVLGAAWGTITGTVTDQTDLTTYLSSTYFPIPTGTTSDYIRGDGSVAAFPVIPTLTWGSITGTLSSQLDLQAELNTHVKLIHHTGTDTSVSGPIIETMIHSALVQGGVLTVGDIVDIDFDLTKLADGTTALVLYTNTTNSLTGASALGSYNLTATNRFISFQRRMTVKPANILWVNWSWLIAGASNIGVVQNSVGERAFDPTIDNYFIISVQNSSATNITVLKNMMIKRYRL